MLSGISRVRAAVTSAALGAMLAMPGASFPGAPATARDLEPAGQIYRDLAASIVRIETQGASIFDPPGAGSGVLLGEAGLIATADHVVNGASELSVVGAGLGRQRAEVVRRAPELDLALIRVEGAVPSRPMSFPRPAALRPGQCVYALGNVMNWGIGIFEGIVALTWCQDCAAGPVDRILTDITAPPGLSGGALVDCASGSLVGIVSFGVVALTSQQQTAGVIGAVPAALLMRLKSEQVACRSKTTYC
jgi:S1-C subfamily serine protease